MKGITLFNYGGSGTIGLMEAGFEVSLVLEISKDMIENGAAQHFIHNYPDIRVLAPEEWNKEDYLEKLRKEDYDIVIGWPPCSGLSMINRHASADNEINHYMYDWAHTVDKIRPKTFVMENAPTLISKGLPILKDLINILKNNYRFTIIRDYAGNHNCCMRRLRTMIVGWRRDIFESIPVINKETNNVTVSDILDNIKKNSPNMTYVPERSCKDLDWVIPDMGSNISIVTHICKNYNTYEDKLTEEQKKRISNVLNKIHEDKNYFDKSPNRLKINGISPSLTSATELIHYRENRPLYIREYAAIMGYPDNFEFLDGLKVPYLQSIAQGVPANFIKWIASDIKYKLEHKELFKGTVPSECSILCEHLSASKPQMYQYTIEQFNDIKNDIGSSSK